PVRSPAYLPLEGAIEVRATSMHGLPLQYSTGCRIFSAPAANELQNDFTSVRPSAVFNYIDALPRAERQFAGNDGYMQRDAGEHGLHMCRHVIRSLHVMDPACIGGREAIERGREVGAYVPIGVFLDDERRGRMPRENEQYAVLHGRLRNEP